jgi:DNA-binding PadR family transcriptional regulator
MFPHFRHHRPGSGPLPPPGAFFERFGRQRRHGEDDEGWGWPPFGAFGRPWRRPGRRAERLFERGDLKYVILDLLKEQPRHGYDVIRALEERFQGYYSPSPGSVYPTLQLLEDQGLVSGSEQDSKRVFALTDEGRKFLAERAETVAQINARTARGWDPSVHAELNALRGEFQALARVVFQLGVRGAFHDPGRIARLRGVVARARGEVEQILGGDAPPRTDF